MGVTFSDDGRFFDIEGELGCLDDIAALRKNRAACEYRLLGRSGFVAIQCRHRCSNGRVTVEDSNFSSCDDVILGKFLLVCLNIDWSALLWHVLCICQQAVQNQPCGGKEY